MTLPDTFIRQMRSMMADAAWQRLYEGLQQQPSTSIRLNPAKGGTPPEGATKVPWCEYGYYLAERPNFTLDPLLHAGLYYVQEASSMFLHHILRHLVGRPVALLDLCAAPGGKTTTAIGALPQGSTVYCNEPVRLRAQILSENIQKWGTPGVTVTSNYPADYARNKMTFDVILCDVPCSGEGMFRKDEEAVRQWSPQLVDNCQRLQREILASAWQCLHPGGLLVYSTCTFNTKEDEENVKWLMEEFDAMPLDIPVETSWNIQGSLLEGFSQPVYRFLPGFTRGEGLFMAALRKPGRPGETMERKGNGRKKKDHNPLNVLYDGRPAPEIKGGKPVPTHAMALSTALSANDYPQVALDLPTALNYLRRETIPLPPGTPTGYVIVTYQGHPLGFVKNIGSRANNLYPKEWRILSRG